MSTDNVNASLADAAGGGTAAVRPGRPEISRTVRYWGQTILWTVIGMQVCFVFYCVEKYGFHMKELRLPRVFFNPAEIAMRIFGLPHFIVGLFFMFSSRRMRSVKGWLWFFGLLAMGIGFAFAFGNLGGHRNPVMLIAFYFYFLIHGFRDESYFYQNYGDCPETHPRANKRVFMGLQVMLLCLLFAFLMPTYLQYLKFKGKLPVDDAVLNLFFPASASFLIKFVVYLAPAIAISAVLWWALNRGYPGGWKRIWQDHRPILTVFLLLTAIIFATLLVGPWTFNVVVLAHFVGWYLFALRKLDKIPSDKRAQPSRPMAWMRTTQAGFKFLHLGLAVVVTVLILISVYVYQEKSVLDVFVSGPSFYYWTVIHVSLSFYPR